MLLNSLSVSRLHGHSVNKITYCNKPIYHRYRERTKLYEFDDFFMNLIWDNCDLLWLAMQDHKLKNIVNKIRVINVNKVLVYYYKLTTLPKFYWQTFIHHRNKTKTDENMWFVFILLFLQYIWSKLNITP